MTENKNFLYGLEPVDFIQKMGPAGYELVAELPLGTITPNVLPIGS